MKAYLCVFSLICSIGFTATPINKPVNVNKTACECSIQVGDCLCTDETQPFFLIVDIKGPSTDEVYVIIEEKTLPPPPGRQQGRTVGPTFESGSRSYLHTCGQKIGNTIKGGTTPGVYKVFVSAKGENGPDESTKVVCGEICVLGLPGVKQPNPGSKGCPPNNNGQEILVTTCKGVSKASTGEKLLEMKDDCANVLELWCLDNPGEFKLIYNLSQMVHNCDFDKGRNAWDVYFDTCKGKKRFVRVQGWNQSILNEDGNYSVIEYDFDACTNTLRWTRYSDVGVDERPLNGDAELTGKKPPASKITQAAPPYPRSGQLCVDEKP